MSEDETEIFLVATPGLERELLSEVKNLGFADAKHIPGGVSLVGSMDTIWRANLMLRGATRVLMRIAEFRAMHPAQLDKRAHKVNWAKYIPTGATFRVEATSRKSRIYHAGAATSRVEKAIIDETGAKPAKDADIAVKVRIEDDLCTISLDTSGASLHKRGHKEAVNKAPMRETMAAMFLRACRFDGSEPVYDPMCGSGTFPIEAAEIASGLWPGRTRQFAFQQFAGFDTDAFESLKSANAPSVPSARFYGSDRDAGAIGMSSENAKRAGVGDWCDFACKPVSQITAPPGPPGLVIVNPPYGGRIGNKGPLYGLYASLGTALKSEFPGWRVGLITTEAGLAKATDLPWQAPGPIVAHGGLKIRLWQTDPL
jgi:putative N6-adenine-specific DNA methylase